MSFLRNLFSVFRKTELFADENTFAVWEACSGSHGEVIPGFVQYLLDLGYTVSVVMYEGHHSDGLFSRMQNEKLFFNRISRKRAKRYFKKADLSKFKGIMVTTMGKLCKDSDVAEAQSAFSETISREKLLFVEHDAKIAIDENRWDSNIITLRKLNYKNADSVVINPHCFGKVEITPKNPEIVNFVTVGAINPKRKNSATVIEAVDKLIGSGVDNFKVTVIGKGELDDIPERIRPYLDIKGRLPFGEMYAELEKADFMLSSYDPENELHQRYNTVGTSGNFQLSYGFGKPCIIVKDFAEVNGFTENNSIVYESAADYADAMQKAISMSAEDYAAMQKNLLEYAAELYAESRENLANLIRRKGAQHE